MLRIVRGNYEAVMKFARILSTVAVMATVLLSQSVLAWSQITVDYVGSADFGSGGVGYQTGTMAPHESPNSNSLATVAIGGDSFSSSNHSFQFNPGTGTTKFNVWCVDIMDWLTDGNRVYDVITGASSVISTLGAALQAQRSVANYGVTGAQRVADLIKLANQRYGTVDTEMESAAFQLAVWAISFGAAHGVNYDITASIGSSPSTNVGTEGFVVGSATKNSAAGVLADQWLNTLDETIAGEKNYQIAYLSDNPNHSTQDMVVFYAPAPATIALFAIGLLAFSFALRKRA